MSYPIKSAVPGALKRVNDASRDLQARAGKPMAAAIFAKLLFTAQQADEVLRMQRDPSAPDADELRSRVAELNAALAKERPSVYASSDVESHIERDLMLARIDWIVTKFSYRLGDEADSIRGQLAQIRKAGEMSLAREEGARAALNGGANGHTAATNATANGYGALIDARPATPATAGS